MPATLSLLGTPRLVVDGRERLWLPDKRFQLLTYLACQAEWIGREHLQFLFWSDHAPHAAQGSLRQLLRRLRDLEIPGVEVERDRLRWRVETDVASFLWAVDERRWEDALRVYRGPFLHGQDGEVAGEMAAWMDRERERLYRAWRTARLRRAQDLQEQGWHLEAADILQPLLEHEEFDEAALQAQVKALILAGGRERALQVGHAYVQRLRDTVGLEPGADLVALIGTLTPRNAAAAPLPQVNTATSPRSDVAAATTSFVGRDLELAEITRLFAQPECRLLTLTGPGGIGKTRLAIEAARERTSAFPDGVSFVALTALRDPSLIAASVAAQLGLPLLGQADPLTQVIGHVGRRRQLIVLDNHEHLPGDVALALVRGCPNLRLLVTSRERLGLEDEWLFPLSGLDYPEAADVGAIEGSHFDAVRLFLERARQVRPGWTPTGTELPFLLRLCRLVEGSPLALELAAVWVRTLPMAEIVRELERGLDLLTTCDPGKEARHRSLRAVFEYSWQALDAPMQTVLCRMAAFRGGMRLDAARAVIGATPSTLAALIDRSLVRLTPADRYEVHALLHQYLAEKLAEEPEERRAVEHRHRRYYLALLSERGDAIMGPDGGAALGVLDDELENIRAAWERTAAGWPTELRPAVLQAALYHDRRARFQEGLAAYLTAARGLRHDEPDERELLADVLIRQGWFAMRLGQHEEAKTVIARGLELVAPESVSAMHGYNALANVHESVGAYAAAEEHFREAIRLSRVHDRPAREADFSTHLAAVEMALGRYRSAQHRLASSVAQYAAIGYHVGLVFGLCQQGQLWLALGHPDAAESALQRGLALAHQLGVHQRIPLFLHGLGEVALKRGDLDTARRLGEANLERAQAAGSPSDHIAALGLLARVSAAQGDAAHAQAQVHDGLRLAQATGELPRTLSLLTVLAETELASQAVRAATPLLRMVERHPAADHQSRTLAQRLLMGLRTEPRPWPPVDHTQLHRLVTRVLDGLRVRLSAAGPREACQP